MSDRREAFVVCPTEYGGHIEHAYDCARGLLNDPDVGRVTIISRPGARAYLGGGETAGLRVAEVLPPRRLPAPGRRAASLRAAGQVLDLVTEHRAVRREVARATGAPVVIMEVLRFPFPRLIAPAHGADIVSFLHNARPHFDPRSAGLRQRFLMALQSACLRGSDRVVVHGSPQAGTARELSPTPVFQAALPTTSFLALEDQPAAIDVDGRAVCIGEVRANKGVELAITAARECDVPLSVLGKSESTELAAALKDLAHGADVRFEDKFLSRQEFETAIKAAPLIVLPYTHFDAQSGILSKAMGAGRPVLASDLPALRDQARGYPLISFADAHDAAAFGQAMAAGLGSGGKAAAPSRSSEEEWGAVADAILGRG